jgi:hypothetical protein
VVHSVLSKYGSQTGGDILTFFRSPDMRKTDFTKIKLLIFIAFASGALAGCINTQGKLLIEGKVLDESTKTGIPRKNIIVQGLVESNNKLVPVETGLFSTDSSGCFTYELKKIKGCKHYNFCFVGDSDHLFTTKEVSLFDLANNAKFLSFSLPKLVDLTIYVNRKSKRPFCDTLRLIWESNGVYGGSLYPYTIINYGSKNNPLGETNTDLIWIGGNINSTVNTKVFADKRTILSWELYRNGSRKEFTDTITCKRDFANIVHFTY